MRPTGDNPGRVKGVQREIGQERGRLGLRRVGRRGRGRASRRTSLPFQPPHVAHGRVRHALRHQAQASSPRHPGVPVLGPQEGRGPAQQGLAGRRRAARAARNGRHLLRRGGPDGWGGPALQEGEKAL